MAVADAPSAAIDRLTENRQEISGHARDLRQLHQVEIVVVQLSGEEAHDAAGPPLNEKTSPPSPFFMQTRYFE
jgi:hypothetical protein